MFFKYLRARKLRRVGNDMASYINQISGQSLIELTKTIESAEHQAEEPSGVIWTLQAFGIHLVDHYSRNHVDEYERVGILLPSLISSIHNQSREIMTYFKLKSQQNLHEYWLKNIQAILSKLEACNIVHAGGPANRDVLGVSLGVTSIVLFANYVTDADVPAEKLDEWEEMEPHLLDIYDKTRRVAWDFHQLIKLQTYTQLEGIGYKKVRDLGVYL